MNRRDLLRTLGLGPAMLPLLESDLRAAGCPDLEPRRAVFVVWGNGFLTTADERPGRTLPDSMSPLEPHRQDLLFLDGVDYRCLIDTPADGEKTGHSAFPGLLTGARYAHLQGYTGGYKAGGPSIDQHIGAAIASRGFKGVPALHLGVVVAETHYSVWRAARTPVIPEQDPYRFFDQHFAGRTGGGADPAAERLRRTRRSVLDFVARDLTRFSRTLGTADRSAVAAHLEAIRGIERRLSITPPLDGCRAPEVGPRVDVRKSGNFDVLIKLQMDLMVAALAADLSRVVVLQLGDAGGGSHLFSFLGLGATGRSDVFGDVNSWHSIAHNDVTAKRKIDRFFFEQFAYLIGKMKTVGGAGRSLLDRSALVFMNGMQTGLHAIRRVPVMIAGSCGGYLKTGRTVGLPSGTPHNGVLVAIANAMDVPLTSWGDPSYGGELAATRG